MASIRKRGKVWYYRYTDATGVKRERRGCADRRETEGMAAAAEAEAAKIRAGYLDPRAARCQAHEARPLAAHLEDYRADLAGKGDVPRYVQQVASNVARVLTLAGMVRLSDLSPSRVQGALAKLRSGGLSLQTVNHSLRHIKGFARWLHRDGRIAEDNLAHLAASSVATDRRHDRRALTEAEARALIRAAEAGPTVLGISGPDRAVLYRLALGTGFRANELGSLTPESFALDAAPPVVTVAAAYSKRRREDRQPIRPDLAADLRPWLAGKASREPVFALPGKPARMLRVDLAAAGIPYRDTAGRVADFHALRHTFISMVVSSGASVKASQVLARHSTPTLTIGRYAHADLREQAGALDALPDLATGHPAP